MFSSYNLSAALVASDAVCDTPAFASSAAELPLLEDVALSMAEETLLVTDSESMDVSLLDGLSLVREGRDGMMRVVDGLYVLDS